MPNVERTRHVTLRDVATAAGVSLSSASRALAGHQYVSGELAERVQSAAAELGYQPNEGARSLRTSRSMTLAVLCHQLRQLPVLDFIDGFGAGADAAGYAVLVANARGDDDQYRTLLRRLLERRIDGLVITGPGDLTGLLKPYQDSGVPVMLNLWRAPSESDIPLVTTSELGAVREAMTRLRELGHESIAYFGTPRTLYMQRPSCVTQAASENQLACHMAFVAESTTAEVMARHLAQVMEASTGATALAVNHSLMAPTMGAIRLLGLRVPEDLSLFLFTDYQPADAYLERPISAIHINVVEMGMTCANLLTTWIIQGTQPPNISDLTLSSWVETGSIGPRPQKAPLAEAVLSAN